MVRRLERNVNVVQEVLESAAVHTGRIASIIGRSVRDVAREIGDAISEGFELAEANRRARADEERLWRDASETPEDAEHLLDEDVEEDELDTDDADVATEGDGESHEDFAADEDAEAREGNDASAHERV